MKLDKDDLIAFAAIMFVVFAVFGLMYVANQHKRKQNLKERITTEEFFYKGHQYIMFETNRTFDGISVVHDPNCECQIRNEIKNDSTNI